VGGKTGSSINSSFMTEDLKSMATRRKEAHAELLARDSAVYRAFLEMEQAAFADGVLPKKVKELIAVGISVVINCKFMHAMAHRAGSSRRRHRTRSP
jgi:AhpD family alkylhydroperoxidase